MKIQQATKKAEFGVFGGHGVGQRSLKVISNIAIQQSAYDFLFDFNPLAIVWHCLRDSTFSHFDTILECDTQTVRHADT